MCKSDTYLLYPLQDYVGELLFSIYSSKPKDSVTLVISKAKDLHIEDEISVLGKLLTGDGRS